MPVVPRRPHSPEVEVGNGVGVYPRGQRQRRPDYSVLALGDQVRLPLETLDLPCAENESGNGYDGWGGAAPGPREGRVSAMGVTTKLMPMRQGNGSGSG